LYTKLEPFMLLDSISIDGIQHKLIVGTEYTYFKSEPSLPSSIEWWTY